MAGIRAFLGALPGDGDPAAPGRCTIVDVGHMTVAQACAHFGDQAAIPKELIHLFALFYVSAAGSVHRFLDDDVLKDVLGQLPPGEFLFTKGTLRANEEIPLLKSEPALSLLFADTEYRVDVGAIVPTDAQLEKLDDFANPEFRAKKQYVELAQTVHDYSGVKLRECEVLPSGDPNAPLSLIQGIVTGPAEIQINFSGVHVTCRSVGTPVQLGFRQIRRWVRLISRAPLTVDKFGVEFCVKSEVFVWVYFQTDEALLAEHTMATIAPLLMSDLHPEWPAPKKGARPKGGKEENLAWLSSF